MPQLNPIDRPSLTISLTDRYKTTYPLANVGSGTAQAASSDGAPGTPGVTDMVDVGNTFQTGFKPRQPVQVTMFKPKSLNYAKTLGVDGIKYRG